MSEVDNLNALSYKIIGASYEVRKHAGRFMRERYYELALAHELRKMGLNVECQVKIPAYYKGVNLDYYFEADLIIEKCIIVELKAVYSMGENEARQLIAYLRMTGLKLGLLINFGAKSFRASSLTEALINYPGATLKDGIYRIVNGI